MIIDARSGFVRGRILVDGHACPVHRESGGWLRIQSPTRADWGRLRYHGFRDWIEIERPEGPLLIRFGFRRTKFVWKGARYELGPMIWGDVSITREGRHVLRGKVTFRGVRIHYVAPELRAIARELALGLAFRAQALWLAFGALAL